MGETPPDGLETEPTAVLPLKLVPRQTEQIHMRLVLSKLTFMQNGSNFPPPFQLPFYLIYLFYMRLHVLLPF